MPSNNGRMEKNMKKKTAIYLFLCIILVLAPSTSVFADTTVDTDIDYLEDGSYYETIIEVEEPGISFFATKTTKDGKKTTTYKNSNGTTLWSVTVHGVFSYNGSTSSCTSSKASTTDPSTAWSIKNKDASKSGSTARAKATAVQKQNGAVINTVTKTVSLTCNRDGKLS